MLFAVLTLEWYDPAGTGMNFDEFEQKLAQVRRDFEAAYGRRLETVDELVAYVQSVRLRPGRKKFVRSVKGLI